ncbi:hypothetical protein F5880DRAFT_1603613 [Lentinula raphanica]|nr:hypothetical protein F5880DRAFT_1603613 [Lentinula raphanica]
MQLLLNFQLRRKRKRLQLWSVVFGICVAKLTIYSHYTFLYTFRLLYTVVPESLSIHENDLGVSPEMSRCNACMISDAYSNILFKSSKWAHYLRR